MAERQIQARLTSSHFNCDKVQIISVDGREAISKPFRFELRVACTEPAELDEDAVVGADVTLLFEEAGTEVRAIHGMIAELDELGDADVDHRGYRLLLVPRAHRLALVETQEIFMGLSIPEIVKAKLELVGLVDADVEFRLQGSYEPREFVVEYKETDIAFISRLTEHLGISFFFEHESGVDKIVFTDHPSGFRSIVGPEKVAFRPRADRRDIHQLDKRTRMFPSTYVVQDYNYRTPQVDLTATHTSSAGHAGGVVEFGAHAKSLGEGLSIARARAEEREARSMFFVGEASICRLSAGATFELVDHPRHGDVRLLVVETEHRLQQAALTHGGEKEMTYTCQFRCVDAKKTYRPPLVTPKPRIAGVLTGRVEPEPGEPAGSLARIDEQGRYLIRFLFDTASFSRSRPSHPVRMLQPHAGPNYGMHFPLKPGIEVLVTFVDGDPDRPLIVGSAPNPQTPSPVNRQNPQMHTIKTSNGIAIHMKDL